MYICMVNGVVMRKFLCVDCIFPSKRFVTVKHIKKPYINNLLCISSFLFSLSFFSFMLTLSYRRSNGLIFFFYFSSHFSNVTYRLHFIECLAEKKRKKKKKYLRKKSYVFPPIHHVIWWQKFVFLSFLFYFIFGKK